jgi:hypothetical protein
MAVAIAKLLWAASAVVVLGVAALHGRKWQRRQARKARMQDTPRPRVPHANEGRVSQRPEYRSRGPRRAS